MLIVDISHTSYCNFADDINGHSTCRWCDDLSIKMNNTSAPKASCKTKTGLMKVSFHEFTLLNLWCLKGTKNIEPLKSKTNQMFTTFKFMSHANISPSGTFCFGEKSCLTENLWICLKTVFKLTLVKLQLRRQVFGRWCLFWAVLSLYTTTEF